MMPEREIDPRTNDLDQYVCRVMEEELWCCPQCLTSGRGKNEGSAPLKIYRERPNINCPDHSTLGYVRLKVSKPGHRAPVTALLRDAVLEVLALTNPTLSRITTEVVGWQPIETAPVNEVVLLYIPRDGFVDEKIETGIGRREQRFLDGRIVPGTASRHGRATHWMPLPTGEDER